MIHFPFPPGTRERKCAGNPFLRLRARFALKTAAFYVIIETKEPGRKAAGPATEEGGTDREKRREI